MNIKEEDAPKTLVDRLVPHEVITDQPCSGFTHPHASVGPRGSMELLSQQEVQRLRQIGHGDLYELFRRCALAVLNCDDVTDSAEEVYDRYADFDIENIVKL